MKTKSLTVIPTSHAFRIILAVAIISIAFVLLGASKAAAVIVTDLGTSAPTSNILLANPDDGSTNVVQWRTTDTVQRIMMLDFVATSNFTMDDLVLHVKGLGYQPANKNFSISIIELTTKRVPPTAAQWASPLYTETGALPSTLTGSSWSNNYVSFALDNSFTFTSGKVYGISLTLTDTAAAGSGVALNLVQSATPAPNTDYDFMSTDGGTTWSINGSHVFYLLGVPEPAAVHLLAGIGLLLFLRKTLGGSKVRARTL